MVGLQVHLISCFTHKEADLEVRKCCSNPLYCPDGNGQYKEMGSTTERQFLLWSQPLLLTALGSNCGFAKQCPRSQALNLNVCIKRQTSLKLHGNALLQATNTPMLATATPPPPNNPPSQLYKDFNGAHFQSNIQTLPCYKGSLGIPPEPCISPTCPPISVLFSECTGLSSETHHSFQSCHYWSLCLGCCPCRLPEPLQVHTKTFLGRPCRIFAI